MTARDLRSRLSGVSIAGVGGASWQPRETDRAIAQRVLTYLEDRRVLYSPYECELPDHCFASVLEIRRFLTHELGAAGDRSDLTASLRAMRAACRRFLDQNAEAVSRGEVRQHRGGTPEWIFNQSLGELRALTGVHIAAIALHFDLNVEEVLAATLPPPPREDDGAAWLLDQFEEPDR